jgi:hypothetical protein
VSLFVPGRWPQRAKARNGVNTVPMQADAGCVGTFDDNVNCWASQRIELAMLLPAMTTFPVQIPVPVAELDCMVMVPTNCVSGVVPATVPEMSARHDSQPGLVNLTVPVMARSFCVSVAVVLLVKKTPFCWKLDVPVQLPEITATPEGGGGVGAVGGAGVLPGSSSPHPAPNANATTSAKQRVIL